MSQMLTAKEIQALLEVDRSTVYRMAEDGRLPAIKVGRQWRFPAQKIEKWLEDWNVPLGTTSRSLPRESAAEPFPVACLQMVQDTFAEALGVMIIITDMSGNPITRFSNACGLFSLLDENDLLWQKCISHWQEMADSLSLEPQYLESYLGLLCTRAFIRHGSSLMGMVFVGGIAPEDWPHPVERLTDIAIDLGADPALVLNHVEEVYFLSEGQKAHVLTLVQKIANVVSHILHERQQLTT